jgi:hypothetical protein
MCSHVKTPRLEPLSRFEDLVFQCSFTFLNEKWQERSTDECFGTELEVAAVEDGAMYRLTGKFFSDEPSVRRYSLSGSGEYHYLDFAIDCRIGRHTIAFATLPRVLERKQLTELLPMGKSHRRDAPSSAPQSWRLEVGALELVRLHDSDEQYPFIVVVERRRQDFYVRRLELLLPRDVCHQWFDKAVRLLRQDEAGVTTAV